MKLSVPGNIILLGEYAVLEEGGLGAAAAVERRVHLETEPAQSLSIEGVWSGGSFSWTPERRDGSAVVTAVYDVVREWMLSHGRQNGAPAVRIRIDSSELYSKAGRKTGFGSSAAVAVALVLALRGNRRLDRVVPRLALEAHRLAQGGAGSGYDVYCSYFGGWGMFRGGVEPSWTERRPPIGPQLFVFPGPAPVSTAEAIRAFHQWKVREPGLARQFIKASNTNVEAFLSARSAGKAVAAFRNARDTVIALGDAIGVEARIPCPPGVDPEMCKSLGAGNELGVYLRLPGEPEPPAEAGSDPIEVSPCGISWQR
ncbi:MAG: hypothetical protein ABSG17_00250 [Spirochaetia bacterium]|jgi:phosphomevalonate kinase